MSLNQNSCSKSNFEKVMEFNRAFDMVEQEPIKYTAYTTDNNGNITYNPFMNARKKISCAIIKLRLDLIKEEIEELIDATKQNDIIEQRDACADILYVVYGMADVMGIAINDVFKHKIYEKITKYYNNKQHIDNIQNNSYPITEITEITNGVSTIRINNEYTNEVNEVNDVNKYFNSIRKYSNFNYVKHFYYELLGYNVKELNVNKVIEYIITKLTTNYTALEYICNNYLNSIYSVDSVDSVDIDNINTIFETMSCKLYKLLRWVYILTLILKIDADADFDIIHNSNMSKLCDNEEDANLTVNYYKDKFLTGLYAYDSPYYYYLPNINKWIVKNLSSGKALKNINYKAVSFSNSRFVF